MAGEGAEGKVGSGSGSGEDTVTLSAEELKSLREKAGKADELIRANEELVKKTEAYERDLMSDSYLAFLEKEKKRKEEGGGGTHTEEEEKEEKWDEMTNSQLAKTLLSKVSSMFESFGKKLDESFGEFDERVGRSFAEIDVMMTALKHKDFGDALYTKPESRTPEQKILIELTHKVAKENPNWSTERCLTEARRQIKESQEQKAKLEEEKKERERKLLSEKGGASAHTVITKGLPKEEAAEKAWDAIFGNASSVG